MPKNELMMVSFDYPCTACLITENLVLDVLNRVKRDIDFDIKIVKLERPSEVSKVEGLEVEKFPALFLNGEQISAGNIIGYRELKALLEM
ncbi:MAG: thioredoxin family protein [Clostridiales bacterium]|jgi:glutaredoxin|nr:thioredoxin family protein [Clostridiales bacterium]